MGFNFLVRCLSLWIYFVLRLKWTHKNVALVIQSASFFPLDQQWSSWFVLDYLDEVYRTCSSVQYLLFQRKWLIISIIDRYSIVTHSDIWYATTRCVATWTSIHFVRLKFISFWITMEFRCKQKTLFFWVTWVWSCMLLGFIFFISNFIAYILNLIWNNDSFCSYHPI